MFLNEGKRSVVSNSLIPVSEVMPFRQRMGEGGCWPNEVGVLVVSAVLRPLERRSQFVGTRQ